jgi:hypothetical protein
VTQTKAGGATVQIVGQTVSNWASSVAFQESQ